VVYFVDAAHFVFHCYLGFLWCFTRVCVRAPSGRQRFNVLGALNAVTHQLLTITNQTYITSIEVCALLYTIAAAHQNQVITVILDNARYQRCARVQDCAHLLNIELLFLPPYSPNFNLIERLWGFVKDTCLYSQFYNSFADFKQAISTCLSETQGIHRSQLNSLLTLNFQTFKKVKL
jgi:transposase